MRLLPTTHDFTPIPNAFILKSMSKMSSTVIKIYLFILYQFHQHYLELSIDEIADALNVTESDINRAIQFLTKEKLLLAEMENGSYLSLSLASDLAASELMASTAKEKAGSKAKAPDKSPISIASGLSSQTEEKETGDYSSTPAESTLKTNSERPNYDARTVERFAQDSDGNQLIFYTKTLLQKNLTAMDLHILLGFRDWLKMSNDLIYFLVDYCSDKNHTNLNYIEKVAIDWHEHQIKTVEQAKDYVANYPNHYYTVLKAYGIYNLAPIPAQIKMIDKWTKEYLMPMEAIVYACEKTILQTGKPELNYTDSILKKWKEKNIYTKEQIQKAEAEHQKKQYAKATKEASKVKSTSFNNYQQRDEDYDAIERRALEMRLKNKES